MSSPNVHAKAGSGGERCAARRDRMLVQSIGDENRDHLKRTSDHLRTWKYVGQTCAGQAPPLCPWAAHS